MPKQNKTIFYLVYSASVGILAVAVLSSSPAIVAVSAVSMVIAVALLHYGHMLNGVILRKTGVVEVCGRYQLSQDMHAISRKEGEMFRSISVATLRLREGSAINTSSIKDLLDSISEQFEFSVELAEIDKERLIENLRTKLRLKEIALSRASSGPYDRANWLRRQIDVMRSDLSSLSNSGKSFEYVIRIKAICTLEDETEAKMYSARSIHALASKFSLALSADYEILHGEKLLECAGV